ncbi:MAG: hypothetical protein KF850_39225 [Labilithrix sp.]|nr:hypothetical protein [Labilithrix sp.]
MKPHDTIAEPVAAEPDTDPGPAPSGAPGKNADTDPGWPPPSHRQTDATRPEASGAAVDWYLEGFRGRPQVVVRHQAESEGMSGAAYHTLAQPAKRLETATEPDAQVIVEATSPPGAAEAAAPQLASGASPMADGSSPMADGSSPMAGGGTSSMAGGGTSSMAGGGSSVGAATSSVAGEASPVGGGASAPAPPVVDAPSLELQPFRQAASPEVSPPGDYAPLLAPHGGDAALAAVEVPEATRAKRGLTTVPAARRLLAVRRIVNLSVLAALVAAVGCVVTIGAVRGRADGRDALGALAASARSASSRAPASSATSNAEASSSPVAESSPGVGSSPVPESSPGFESSAGVESSPVAESSPGFESSAGVESSPSLGVEPSPARTVGGTPERAPSNVSGTSNALGERGRPVVPSTANPSVRPRSDAPSVAPSQVAPAPGATASAVPSEPRREAPKKTDGVRHL